MRLAHWLRRSRPRHKGWNIGWDRHSFSPLLTTLECPDFGSAFDIGRELPPPDIALALTPNSLELTPGIQRRAYWEEVNPLLANWRSINDAKCPECARVIRVNMSRHLQLMHTTLVCYWRCPAPACPLLMTIYHNQLQFRVTHFVYLPSRRKIRSASHCHRGFRQAFSQHGLKLKD